MKISNEKKSEYWYHYVAPERKRYRPNGVTDKRLEAIKPIIWQWEYFWDDVIARHGGLDKTPSQLDGETYNHSIGNFYGMIFELLVKYGIIK